MRRPRSPGLPSDRPSRHPRPHRLLVLAAAALLATACGDDGSDGAEPADPSSTTTATTAPPASSTTGTISTTTTAAPAPEPLPIPNATLTEIVAEGAPWAQSTSFDLTEVGYTQTEYTLAGTARSFTAEGDLTEDGRWTVGPDDEAEYATRVLVHRPADPADFKGTLVVEWFNVSGGLDAAPDWVFTHTELIREGYAWVGVSAQVRGVEPSEGGVDVGFPLDLKSNNPERYGHLRHPGDSYSYDIYSQAAHALLEPGDVDPLAGLDVARTIAMGESQSASRLTTYLNAVDPITGLFDGFLIHSRGGGSSALADGDDSPEMPERVMIRDDVRVPVLTFLSETDVFDREGRIRDQQPDTEMYRLWQGAGTAHGDTYNIIQEIGPADRGDDPSVADVVVISAPIPGIIECAEPINSGPQHWLVNAAIHALDEWIISGEPPPEAPRFEIDDSGRFVLDELGNVVGGIRTPWVDAPVATLSGLGQTGDGFCRLFGTTVPFDEATLAELYPDNATYVAAVETSLRAAVDAGHIRPADADLIRRAAEDSGIGG